MRIGVAGIAGLIIVAAVVIAASRSVALEGDDDEEEAGEDPEVPGDDSAEAEVPATGDAWGPAADQPVDPDSLVPVGAADAADDADDDAAPAPEQRPAD